MTEQPVILSQEEKGALLRAAIAGTLKPGLWGDGWWPPRPGKVGDNLPSYEIWVANPTKPQERLVVSLRYDGDLQVEYHAEGVLGSPWEASYIAPPEQAAECVDEVANVVHDLLTERRVVVATRGWLTGRVKFRLLAAMEDLPSHEVAWVRSWNGTYDRGA